MSQDKEYSGEDEEYSGESEEYSNDDEEYSGYVDEHTERLSATMAMLSETYPTVVYYKKAVACGLPEHFMDLRHPPDKWGRVPCKREAMDWYLKDSQINEEVKKNVHATHKEDLEAAKHYMNLDITKSKAETTDGELVTVGKKDGDNSIQAKMGPATSNSE